MRSPQLETRYLWFLRHGRADWPDWEQSDDDRPLTKKGRREVKRVVRFCRRLPHQPDLILTSPLPRAWETAKIAADKLGIDMREMKMLSPGFKAKSLPGLLDAIDTKSVMLVGHEPDFSEAITQLTGARVKLPKGGLALVRLTGEEATLLALLPPSLAKDGR